MLNGGTQASGSLSCRPHGATTRASSSVSKMDTHVDAAPGRQNRLTTGRCGHRGIADLAGIAGAPGVGVAAVVATPHRRRVGCPYDVSTRRAPRHGGAADLLSVTAAAQLTGLSRSIISNWITRGILPAVRMAGRRYVQVEDLLSTHAAVHGRGVVPAWRQDPAHAGRRLRMIREAAGLSQLQVAAASGLPHETLSRWETGTWVPLGRSVLQLAQALRVDPARFVGREAIGLDMLTTAEAAFRLDVPIGRVRTWVKVGGASWGESLRAVAGAGGGGGGAGPQWSPARRESPPRSALSRLTRGQPCGHEAIRGGRDGESGASAATVARP